MNDGGDRREEAVGVVSVLVLGAGFVGMYLGLSWFWMIWVLGFAVLVPLLSILLGVDDESSEADDREEPSEGSTDALETFRERYARGELTDEQFERKLERLLETGTIEDVEDARRRAREDRTDAANGTDRWGSRTRGERER